MHPTLFTQAWTQRRITITIPGSGGTAATLISLAQAGTPGLTGDEAANLAIGGRVLAASAAYNAGDAVASQPAAIAVNQEYSEPCVRFLHDTFVKAAAAGTISVVLVVYMRAP